MDNFAFEALTQEGADALTAIHELRGTREKERSLFRHFYDIRITSTEPLVLAVFMQDEALNHKGLRVVARLLGSKVKGNAIEHWRSAMPEIRKRFIREMAVRGALEDRDFISLGFNDE